MKSLSRLLFYFLFIAAITVFDGCKEKKDETETNTTISILTSKSPWVVSSVNVPLTSATVDSDWVDFKVSFTSTNMTTVDYPTGAKAVWPSDQGRQIDRSGPGD